MSEASEKVVGIERLPIFPLPLVLLPNELLPLHIFEPRYRRLLKDIEAGRKLFGVNYFAPDKSLDNHPAPGSVGCATEVRDVQMLPDGRSNILTVGVIRYRIVEYVETDDEYLVAEVEFFEDDDEDKLRLDPLADRVFVLFQRIARAAHSLGNQRGSPPEIVQSDPQTLSFLVTAAFNLEPEIKLQMLETQSTVERLERLLEILLQAVDKMEENAAIHRVSQTNGHVNKKID